MPAAGPSAGLCKKEFEHSAGTHHVVPVRWLSSFKHPDGLPRQAQDNHMEEAEGASRFVCVCGFPQRLAHSPSADSAV